MLLLLKKYQAYHPIPPIQHVPVPSVIGYIAFLNRKCHVTLVLIPIFRHHPSRYET